MGEIFLEVFGKRLIDWRASVALFGVVFVPPLALGLIIGYLLAQL